MNIVKVDPQGNYTLKVVARDGRVGIFDVRPYLRYEAFSDLKSQTEFCQVSNGGYFIEWRCGADLSSDTIEAQWQVLPEKANIRDVHQSSFRELS